MPDTTNGVGTSTPRPGGLAKEVSADFVKVVREWCEARADRVGRCVIAPFEGRTTIWVISTQSGFDFALAKELSEWGLHLHRSGLPSMVHQLPGGEPNLYPHYISDQTAIHVFGQQ